MDVWKARQGEMAPEASLLQIIKGLVNHVEECGLDPAESRKAMKAL